ncbi:MAG TPA: sigma-70 family RNA polymerase sigma factor [Thermoanaerobaculia bacterium]|jgi:RNA polymerase sigma factor (sigma-70 family)
MHPRELLEANLGVVERAIAAVCASASISGADAEDFASSVKVALLDNDCAIIRQWQGRSSFATYVTVIIRRLLVDHQRAQGRWYASAAAQRQGEAAVLLERLLVRDRRSVDEAFAAVLDVHPHLTRSQLAAMAAAFPERAVRARLVAVDEQEVAEVPGVQRADERVHELDLLRRARRASEIMQAAMAEMSDEDRLILRLRFAKDVSVADIARVLDVPARPLYRRVEALLTTLRRTLERSGAGAREIGDLIGSAGERLDFRFDGQLAGKPDGKTTAAHPSLPREGEGSEDLR